jgi:cytochrome c oxidase cbb3-type subunit I/II
MAAGMFYWLVPRLYGTKLHSTRAADLHFWTGTVGILLYVVSMWVSGITQGLMWKATTPDGALLYPSFVETLLAIRPMYIVRAVGGTLYLSGFILMAWNLWRTARSGKAVDGEAVVWVEDAPPAAEPVPGWLRVITGTPLMFAVAILALAMLLGWADPVTGAMLIAAIGAVSAVAWWMVRREKAEGQPSWFGFIEGRPLAFTVLTLIAVGIGGVAELIPTLLVKHAVPVHGQAQQPYSALELQGRDIYVREGCYVCHSQMIRPMAAEVQRYGPPSRQEESMYDHPFQWGSKRTGPDLARVGGKYPNLWHFSHLMDPRSTSPGSNMPSFNWLARTTISESDAPKKLRLMQRLGVPYTNGQIDDAKAWEKDQGEKIAADLATQGIEVPWNAEIVALIGYLQRLGKGPQEEWPQPTRTAQAPETTGPLGVR